MPVDELVAPPSPKLALGGERHRGLAVAPDEKRFIAFIPDQRAAGKDQLKGGVGDRAVQIAELDRRFLLERLRELGPLQNPPDALGNEDPRGRLLEPLDLQSSSNGPGSRQ